LGGTETPVCFILIGTTVLISLAALSTPNLVRDFAIRPWVVVREGRWYQMFTSGFLHSGFGHLLFNMLTLYFFGGTMERILGSVSFLALYLGSLFFGSLFTILFYRNDPTYLAIGASGAVSGVVFGFVLFRPFAPIYIFFLPIGIPALLFAVGYVALSIHGARTPGLVVSDMRPTSVEPSVESP